MPINNVIAQLQDRAYISALEAELSWLRANLEEALARISVLESR